MSIVLITPPVTSPREHDLLRMFSWPSPLARLHVRKPKYSEDQLQAYIERIPEQYRSRLVLHQHHQLVKPLRLGGVHYREADIHDGLLTATPGQSISLSYHHPEQLLTCKGDVDYVLLSPVFESISKPGYKPTAAMQDLADLAEWIACSRYPVIALGGVTPAHFDELAEVGFAGAALLGYVWEAKDPTSAWAAAVEAASAVEWNDAGGLSCNTV